MTTDLRVAFSTLLQRHRGIVFKVVNTYTRHPDDRDELAQEIAAQLWRAYPDYDPARTFTTWMYRIALNVAISFVRSSAQRGRHDVPLDEGLHDLADPNAGDAESNEELRKLHSFIHAQEPLNRALLLLYLEDRSLREISDV
ncbi:MAG: sigma-70 family RNA polymerase sigma factor, partial [Luteimonas sp.]